MIWVFLGDLPESERYPIPPFPEFDDRAHWRPIEAEFSWNASVDRVVENGIDVAHTSFVHPGFGYREMAARNHTLADGAIFHSDRGTQYTCEAFARAAAELDIRRSVGRTGSCFDKGAALLK